MNQLYLTKIAKHTLIGSLSAYLSFASRNNPLVRQFFFYALGAIALIFLFLMLWEGRDYLLSDESTEESLNTIVSSLSNQKSKRQYYLSAKTRLEIVIAFVVIVMAALIGAL